MSKPNVIGVMSLLAIGTFAGVGALLSCTPTPQPECSVNADCDDNDACNGAETCSDGGCLAGTALNCADDDACTIDSCTNGACVNEPDDDCPEPVAKLLFWGERVDEECEVSQIRRRSTEGGTITNLATLISPDGVAGLEVDVPSGRIYWTLAGSSANCDDRIQRSDLNGEDFETVITFGEPPTCNTQTSPLNLALDVENERFFWVANAGCNPCPSVTCGCDAIRRANLDGTPVTDVVTLTGTHSPRDIALDVAAGKVYWSDREAIGSISRANLNGSGVEGLIDSAEGASELALDVINGKMYWIQSGGTNPCGNACSRIRRANLDGSGEEDVIAFQNQLDFNAFERYRGLAVDPDGGKIYWSVGGFCPIATLNGRIQRADLNGDNIEDVVTGLGLVTVLEIAAAPE